MKKTLNITGLDCAACAAELEEELQKIEGIVFASVSFVMQKIALEYADETALQRAIDAANSFEEVRVLPDIEESNESNTKGSENVGDGKTILKISGLHCAGCAAELEGQIAKIKGIKDTAVDFVGQNISFYAENAAAYEKAVKTANHFEKVRVLNDDEAKKAFSSRRGGALFEHKSEAIRIAVSCLFFLCGVLFSHVLFGTAAKATSIVCYALSYFSVGIPVLVSTAKNVSKGRVFDENFLMTIASVGAVVLGDYAEGAAVMLLYQLGELLQAVAVGSSRRSVADLMALKSESANLVKRGEKEENGAEETIEAVAIETLKIGDEVIVRAGEKIPCDGVLLSSSATLDTKSLTGEAEYRTAKAGDEVLSGCINAGGVARVRVSKAYKDSAVKRILDLMENSSAQKAQSEKFITKFSRYYTPIVCISALVVAFLFPLFGVFGGGTYGASFARWAGAALNFLVISCPCALIISVPLTYFCAIGACARQGVLVKGSVYLDSLARAEILALDKTGTLTKGDFSVTEVYERSPFSKEETLRYAAAAEKNSSHPLAKAFDSVDYGDFFAETVSAEEIAGNGIEALLRDRAGKEYRVTCGKAEYLQSRGVFIEEEKKDYGAASTVYVAVNGDFAGVVTVGDTLRASAKNAVSEMKSEGIKKAVMLTGDTKNRAEAIAKEAGLDEWRAELLPDEKLFAANELKNEGVLLYVGDGINDAPVMAAADCAVSMGKLGAAAAVEASDLVLVSDDLSALAKGRKTAKKARKIVAENIAFSIACKVAFLACSLAGIVPLWLAVFADVGVMTLAVLNALRMSKKNEKI